MRFCILIRTVCFSHSAACQNHLSCFNFTTIISHQICYQSKCKLHQPFVVQVSSVSLSQLNCCDGFFKFPQIYHLCESNKFIYIHIYKENIISRLSTSRYSLMHLQHRLAPIWPRPITHYYITSRPTIQVYIEISVKVIYHYKQHNFYANPPMAITFHKSKLTTLKNTW